MKEENLKLNERQTLAVSQIDGPLLILAGAGAGKTKTIVERIVNIIKSGVDPRNILAVTFTNKSALEMKERVIKRLFEEKLIDEENSYKNTPTIKTFHSLGLMILKEYGHLIGLTKYPTILDTQDSLSIIKESLSKLSLDPKVHDPSKIRNIISREKGEFVTLDRYKEKVASSQMETVYSVWKMYNEELKNQKAVDFDDLINKSVEILENNEMVRNHYKDRFKYIHIDEYQDTNGSQYAFIRLIVGKENNICVVGDVDQNIYSWRGANIKNIMNFEEDFAGAKVILLEENYRSSGNILNLANNSIKKNTVRKDKNLWTKANPGEKIEIIPCWDESSEAELIARKASELIASQVNANEIAVLYRANFQSRILEEYFLKEKVPYTLLGTKFFERREVKDVMSYLRCSLNRSSLVDLKRVIETPKKGLGKVTIAKIFAQEEIPKSAELKISQVYNFLDKIKDEMEKSPLSHIIQMIIVESGMEKELKEGGEDGLERLENIRELVSITVKYDDRLAKDVIDQFLEETSLVSDQDDDKKDKEGVRLMTVHSSKGLEFDYVFIGGLEQDLFPHRNLDGRNIGKEREEEERRLFYVAVTRARKKLFLTHAELRTIFGQKQINAPSEFLEDATDDIAEVKDLYYKEGGGKVVYI